MRISAVREFRDKATGLLRSRTPILVTRRGRLAGIFFPRPEISLPIELKRQLFDMLSSDIARQLKRRKVSETTCSKMSRRRERGTVQLVADANVRLPAVMVVVRHWHYRTIGVRA